MTLNCQFEIRIQFKKVSPDTAKKKMEKCINKFLYLLLIKSANISTIHYISDKSTRGLAEVIMIYICVKLQV